MKAHLIGVEGPFLNEYVDEIVRLMGDVYPEIIENRELERRLIEAEEERFGATLRQGQAYLEEELAKLEGTLLPGEHAFALHDTYGFPVEITSEICESQGVTVDMEGFERCMEAQRARARAAVRRTPRPHGRLTAASTPSCSREFGVTKFVGYDEQTVQSKIVAIVRDGERGRRGFGGRVRRGPARRHPVLRGNGRRDRRHGHHVLRQSPRVRERHQGSRGGLAFITSRSARARSPLATR